MVQAFFDLHLKGEKKTITPTAIATNSKADANAAQTDTGNRQLPSYEQILTRQDTNRDGKIARDCGTKPSPLQARAALSIAVRSLLPSLMVPS